MSLRYRLGLVLLTIAISICVLLGSLGWFAIGFGMMTDCTNNYSCTTTGCPPCDDTKRWINAGGVAQWVLAGVAVAVLISGVRANRGIPLLIGGVTVLVMSALTIVGTTWRADASYCQPDTPGYAASYCPGAP
jgi:hypothetical protein